MLNFNFTDDSKTISREEVLGSSAVDNAPPKQEPLTLVRGFFVASSTNPRRSRTVQDSNRAALRSRVSNQPSGLLLSPRFPTRRNVYQERCRQTFWSGAFFVVGGTGLEQHGHAAGGATNTPVGCCLARGSQCIGMSIKKDAARLIRVRSFCFGGQYRTRTGTSKGRVSP